jgi:hypothetical protein
MVEARRDRAETDTAASTDQPPHKHLKGPELRDYLGEEIWNASYRFSFVRNPWDLMVSTYHWWLQKAPQFIGVRKMAAEVARMGDFGSFVRSSYGLRMINQFFGNQLDWINDGCGDYVHYIGRTETLKEDLRNIVEQLRLDDLPPIPVPHLNQSRRLDYRSYYDLQTAELVRRRFAREIQRFGYDF